MRIDPEDVAVLRALRRMIPGGSFRDRAGDNTLSPRKASLGRVIDVAWSFNVTNQLGEQLGDPRLLQPQRYGRVEWMPDERGQLDEEDWLVQCQPLDVLQYDRALPRAFGPITADQPPFVAAQLGPFALNPAAWWPRDNQPGITVCDIAGSPFWLVVESGPESGTLQRVPIPIVGCSVAVRGRNVAASIEYDPGFGSNGIVFTPLENPVLVTGRGKMLLTITKSQPVARTVVDQTRRLRIQVPQQAPIDGSGVVWIPKFATRLISPTDVDFGTMSNEWLDQTGRSIAVFNSAFQPGIPDGAVAARRLLGDYDVNREPLVFEVFS